MVLVKASSALGRVMTIAPETLADYHKLENLCKGLIVNPLPLTSEVFKRLATSGKLGDTNCG
jgi:hypothetical protein